MQIAGNRKCRVKKVIRAKRLYKRVGVRAPVRVNQSILYNLANYKKSCYSKYQLYGYGPKGLGWCRRWGSYVAIGDYNAEYWGRNDDVCKLNIAKKVWLALLLWTRPVRHTKGFLLNMIFSRELKNQCGFLERNTLLTEVKGSVFLAVSQNIGVFLTVKIQALPFISWQEVFPCIFV